MSKIYCSREDASDQELIESVAQADEAARLAERGRRSEGIAELGDKIVAHLEVLERRLIAMGAMESGPDEW